VGEDAKRLPFPPDASELIDCRWRVAGKMIIGKGVDENASFSDLIAKIDPAAQFG